jgi:nucleotide-binding universal stress UspA family protein
MIKKILLPLKFSHVTDNAFDMALRLAKCCEARLHIFHVLDHRLRDPGVTADKIAEFTRAAERQFEKEYLPLLGEFKSFSFNCWEGDIAMETAKFADSLGADLIIIGCHVKGDRPSRSRLGEVAQALFQWAFGPVMVVPCQLHSGSVTVVKSEKLP